MTGTGHPRAEEIFSRALEIPAEERPRFLNEECGDDLLTAANDSREPRTGKPLRLSWGT